MFKNSTFITAALLVGFTLPAFALQEKPLSNNGTATAFVALNGLTRIAVQNDRILNVRGPDGAYQLKEDDNQGAIFIHPNAEAAKKPFTLFIATESNQDYVLHLKARDQNADTILIKPLDSVNPKAQAWETASPYTEAVTQLINAMATGNSPDGYAVNMMVKAKSFPLGDIALIKPVMAYEGGHLQGMVYQVTNRTPVNLTLTEQEFYQPGDRAIALKTLNVPPYGQTQLYKVMSHG